MTREYAQLPQDEEQLETLEAVQEPSDTDKTALAALISRYDGIKDVETRAISLALNWGYSPDTLATECREIWFRGIPTNSPNTQGGSGHDTTAT